MLNNVRLEVEKESKVSLKLLRFVRRQHFGVDAVEDFKEYTPRDYYCWLKTYYCWLARKNELKAQGTLLMALLDKHQLKFNIHKDAKTLMEAIEKWFGRNKETKKKLISQLEILRESLSQEDINLKFLRSLPTKWRTHTLIWRNKTNLEDQILDDLFNSLTIYEAEVKSSSTTSPTTQNIAFVSFQNTNSTNESVSAVASVSAASTNVPVSTLPNMAMLTMRAKRFLPRTGRNLGANGTTSIGFVMSKVKCYNCHERGHFARKCRLPKDNRNKETQRRNLPVETSTSNALVSQCDGLESVEARILVYQQNETDFEEDIKLLKLDVQLRYNAIVELRKKFEKAKQEIDELKLKLDKFQTSSKNLSQLLSSQINNKTGLGYDNQVFNSSVFDCDEMFSSESDVRTFMPPKPDLVFHDAPTVYETIPTALNVEPSITNPTQDLSQSNRPSAAIIDDWVSDSKDDSEGKPMPTQKAHSFVYSSEHVKTPRPSVKIVKHPIPADNLRNDIPKSRGNPQHALKDKGVIDSGCLRHMTGNMSYLSAFKEINGGYVAFIRNLKGGKITGKGKTRIGKLDFDGVYFVKELKFNLFSVSQMCDKKNSVLFTDTECIVLSSDFKLLAENHVLLRVPRENNMYNVDLKNIVPLGDLTCLFAKATLYETLIEAARTMLADLLLPIPFWAEAVNTACYVQNRVLVTKPHNKTPYELLLGRTPTPSIGFMRPFGCLVTILNTLDLLGKFDGKADEDFWLDTLVTGSGPTWLFDIDTLTKSMNYQPAIVGNQPNLNACIQEHFDADKVREGNVQQCVLFPRWSSGSKDPHNTDDDVTFEVKEPESEVHVSPSSSAKTKKHDDKTKREAKGKSHVELSTGFRNLSEEFEDFFYNSINEVNAASISVPAVGQISTNSTNTFSAASPSNTDVSPTVGKYSYVDPSQYPDDLDMSALEEITYSNDEEDVGAEADFLNLETNKTVSLIPTTRVRKDHPVTQIIGGLSLAPQTRSMTRMVKEQVAAVVMVMDLWWSRWWHWGVAVVVVLEVARGGEWCGGSYRSGEEERFWGSPKKSPETAAGGDDGGRRVAGGGGNNGEGVNDKMIKSTKDMLKSKFDMKDMGLADVILGIKIIRTHNGLLLSQAHYVDKILNTHNAGDFGLARTPIDTSTRPDLAYDVSNLSRYTSNPSVAHWKAVTRVLHYLRYSRDYGLYYDRYPVVIEGYNNANWISDIKDSKSTSGYMFTLGGAAISWKSSKQTVIAKSTMESEFIALDKCEEDAEWLRVISIDYVKSKDNTADPLTKGLSRELVSKSSKGMGLKPLKE
nr:ATP phosphoribosyltransferase 1, chloroplastic [Tanacetum cinerariifolium]